MGIDVLKVCHHQVAGVKFQSAYFENLGLQGLMALSQLINVAREMGLKTIMDAKRGDIGSTSKAYAEAYLSDVNAAGTADFSCDFLTINPLMGEDCLDPFVDVALRHKKGLFILLETSNPGASMILKETLETQKKVNEKIAAYISSVHERVGIKPNAVGPLGCVIGATNSNIAHWREKLPHSTFLMPGIGAQGGEWNAVRACVSGHQDDVWIPISRGITFVPHSIESKDQYLHAVSENADHFSKTLVREVSDRS